MIQAAVSGFGWPGLPEIIIIILAAGLLFGASRIPEIGSNLGKGIRNFRKSFSEADAEEEEEEKRKLEQGRSPQNEEANKDPSVNQRDL